MHTSDFGLDTMEMTCESQNSKWPHSIYRCAQTPLGATCMKLRNQWNKTWLQCPAFCCLSLNFRFELISMSPVHVMETPKHTGRSHLSPRRMRPFKRSHNILRSRFPTGFTLKLWCHGTTLNPKMPLLKWSWFLIYGQRSRSLNQSTTWISFHFWMVRTVASHN